MGLDPVPSVAALARILGRITPRAAWEATAGRVAYMVDARRAFKRVLGITDSDQVTATDALRHHKLRESVSKS